MSNRRHARSSSRPLDYSPGVSRHVAFAARWMPRRNVGPEAAWHNDENVTKTTGCAKTNQNKCAHLSTLRAIRNSVNFSSVRFVFTGLPAVRRDARGPLFC